MKNWLVMEEKKKTLMDISEPNVNEDILSSRIKLLFRDQIADSTKKVLSWKGIVPAVEKIIDKELPVLSVHKN